MKKIFLGYSIKYWSIFLLIGFIYGFFMGWLTDFSSVEIGISAGVLALISHFIEIKFFKKPNCKK